jgi:hypothetical protein
MTPVTVGEQKLSRFKASWLLLKESWRFLRADSELLLVPVVATILMVFLFACLIITVLLTGPTLSNMSNSVAAVQGFLFVTGSYIITAFVVALAQAMVSHTVHTRAHGSDAHFWQSFGVAVHRAPTLFVWALITATVGLVLRALSKRSQWLGQILAGLLGAAWGLMTYFVVPAMILDKKSAVSALKHSAAVFKQTWGESLITNISLSLIFLLMHLVVAIVAFGLIMLGISYAIPLAFVITVIVYVVWLFAAIAIEQVLKAIVTTLLYEYATTTTPPQNFNATLLGSILARQKPQVVPVAEEVK